MTPVPERGFQIAFIQLDSLHMMHTTCLRCLTNDSDVRCVSGDHCLQRHSLLQADLQTTNQPESAADGECAPGRRDQNCDRGASNDSFLLCQRCTSIVLGPGLAKLVEKQFLLPHMRKKSETDDSESEMLHRFWQVPTMHTFENVGFTKNVGSLKYLICADCEVGPIGVYETLEKDGFYVAVDRVRQGEEPKMRPKWP